MDRLEMLMLAIEEAMETRRKRHIIGGVLMSVSLFFGGLAFTVITLKTEESDDE